MRRSARPLLTSLNALRSWVESRVLAVGVRLEQLAAQDPGLFPEQIVAEATRVPLLQATTTFKRAAAVELLPEFGQALAHGAVNVDHLDVVAKSLAGLDAPTRQRLGDRDQFLAGVASRTTAPEFARTLRTEIQRARTDDGVDRLIRQRQATRLRTWVDRETGMWRLRGEFDPETGATLHRRLGNAVEALFHDSMPDTCPTDPLEKHDHLRGLALLAITANGPGACGGVDMSVLVDGRTLVDGRHPDTVIDCGLPIDLPVETIRRLACVADVTPIIVGADGVHMELGRTTRLANRSQRRALRAMYRGCAVPGCCTRWDSIVIHHLRYFHNGGATDICNLLPLCTRHHHLAHEGGWQLSLDEHRVLTITKPDGTTMSTGPPSALAA